MVRRIYFTRHALRRCAERGIHPPLVMRVVTGKEPRVIRREGDQLVLRMGQRELVVCYDDVDRVVTTAFWQDYL